MFPFFLSFYLFPRSLQSKHIAEEWLGSCLYFQNADYCADPAGFVFSSKHSGDVSPKVAPWCHDPWPSVGDPTRCGVCAGTVARGSSVSRGEALSPQTATESMARGVLSAPLSIILPPCLSLSCSLPLFLSLTLSFTLFLLATVSHFVSFSVSPCSPLCFCFSLTFTFPTSLALSLRYPFFHLGYQLSFFFSLYCTRLLLPPSLTYPHFNLPSALVPPFLPLGNLFHLCLSSVFAHTFSLKMFFTCPLNWQSRCSGRNMIPCPNS